MYTMLGLTPVSPFFKWGAILYPVCIFGLMTSFWLQVNSEPFAPTGLLLWITGAIGCVTCMYYLTGLLFQPQENSYFNERKLRNEKYVTKLLRKQAQQNIPIAEVSEAGMESAVTTPVDVLHDIGTPYTLHPAFKLTDNNVIINTNKFINSEARDAFIFPGLERKDIIHNVNKERTLAAFFKTYSFGAIMQDLVDSTPPMLRLGWSLGM